MSVIASPIQQGPAPPNTQTRIHNNTLKVASVGGGQNAVYHVVGGAINNNVNLNLPALAADDTVATLGQNNNWTGTHSFANGFSAQGPITTTAISANGPITTNDAIKATGNISGSNITASGNLTANGNLVVNGNFTPNNLSTPGTLGVGGAATITGTINLAGTTNTGNMNVTGSHTVSGLHIVTSAGGLTNKGNLTALNPSNKAYVVGTGHLLLRNDTGGVDADYFGLQMGATKGTLFGTAASNAIGFYGGWTGGGQKTGSQYTGSGTVFAGANWTTTETNMLNNCYQCLRNNGFMG